MDEQNDLRSNFSQFYFLPPRRCYNNNVNDRRDDLIFFIFRFVCCPVALCTTKSPIASYPVPSPYTARLWEGMFFCPSNDKLVIDVDNKAPRVTNRIFLFWRMPTTTQRKRTLCNIICAIYFWRTYTPFWLFGVVLIDTTPYRLGMLYNKTVDDIMW